MVEKKKLTNMIILLTGWIMQVRLWEWIYYSSPTSYALLIFFSLEV